MFVALVCPLLVGILVSLFEYWLNKKTRSNSR
ncbi:type I toxin-antitoxin system Fst family toxin [Enterococcus plantarum]